VHPNVKCGPEPLVLRYFLDWIEYYNVKYFKINEGVSIDLLKKACKDFIWRIITDRDFKATKMCVKDPLILLRMDYLNELFPQAKFVYMIRDGRASAFSNVLYDNYSKSTFDGHLKKWVVYNKKVSSSCERLGEQSCLRVKYEDLIIYPEKILRQVITFLNEKWTNNLLKHNYYFNKSLLNVNEWSSKQIVRSINNDSLFSWKNKVNISKHHLDLIKDLFDKFDYKINIKS